MPVLLTDPSRVMALDAPLGTLNVSDPSAGFPLRNDEGIVMVEYYFLFGLIINKELKC